MRSASQCLAFLVCLLALFLSGCTDVPEPGPNYHEYAYITNGGSNTVTVVDLRVLQASATVPVGRGPTGVTESPTRNEIYVVNTDSNNISVIDAESNKVVSTIGVHRAPFFISVSADGKRGYVANSGSANLTIIDLAARKVIKTIQVGGGSNLARVTPDGKLGVVALRDEDAVAIVDATTLTLRDKIKTCAKPGEFVILADSSKAFVTCPASNQIGVVDLGNSKDAKSGKLLTLLDVGKTPLHIALKPDGGEIFVCNFDSSSISEAVTNLNEVSHTFLIGKQPVRALVSPDNALLYVTNFGSDSVGIYDIDRGRWTNSVDVGNRPEALALESPGHCRKSFYRPAVAESLKNLWDCPMT